MQRNFEPMRNQVQDWRVSELTDVTAKVVIYEAFVEDKLEAPKHLARAVHDLLLAHFSQLTNCEGDPARGRGRHTRCFAAHLPRLASVPDHVGPALAISEKRRAVPCLC